MRRVILRLVCCAALALVPLAVAAKVSSVKDGGVPRDSRQLILVTTLEWGSVRGMLQRFERRGPRDAWRPVGEVFPVVVGRNGLGWGAGLNTQTGEGPSKKEGDGKAPAGVFALGSAFGFAQASGAAWLKLAYTPLDDATECVDDTGSRRYNRIVERDSARDVDWKSSERMRSVEGYRWGLVVEHNAAPPVPGRGSCIFLHIWAGPEKGTAGCTAMEQSRLEELLHWLDAKKRPVLAQLPDAEYVRLRGAWHLP
jgi:zinc D-Ala-D-Ala dipeptidase